MNERFDIRKAIACVGLVCRENAGVVDLYRLVKTVYLADRKNFVETFRPITNDSWVNMPHGPVNSVVYDLTKGQAKVSLQDEWGLYFENKNNSIHMKKEPNLGVLTGLEEESIKNAVDYLKDCGNFYSIRDKVHKLPEYEETNSSKPVDVSKILKSEYPDISDEEVAEIMSDMKEMCG